MNMEVNKDVRERIYHVLEISNKLNRANLGDNATFEELGFDSLDTVELIVAFEEELGFDLPHEEAENNIKTGWKRERVNLKLLMQ
jgi:NADH dehydrogenase (ubiquinone) 1 alpha/beta subcomplex 1